MEKLYTKLADFGYVDHIVYAENELHATKKEILFMPYSLFFVDMAYRVMHTYVFAISAPKYDVKGLLTLDLNEYHTLTASTFAEKFNIEVEQSWEEITIRRQYGMRKVLQAEFDSSRYILRKGFPNFPSCPFGHTFKMLGYDMQEKTYVRLASAILKNSSLDTIEYKE